MVNPQPGLIADVPPSATLPFRNSFLQPMDGTDAANNTLAAMEMQMMLGIR